MKLLYISSDVSAIHLNLLEALRKQGIESTLGTYTTQKDAKLSLHTQNVLAYKSKSPFKGPILYVTRLKAVSRYYLSQVLNSSIDITHGNMMFGDGFVCRKIFEKADIPYVLSVRNTDLNLWFLWKLPWIKKAGMKNLLSATAIIFLSAPYKNLLLRRIPENVRSKIEKKCIVIPNGIDDFWFDNKKKNTNQISTKIRFVTAGRIEENKNQLAVAEAINLFIKKRGIQAKYSVVGDCRDVQMKEALMKYDFVEIIPFKEMEELLYIFRDSDIYIMPSHTETFGLVYAEAMTQGLPVIYTRGQGFDEQFPEGCVGYSVDSRSVESILDGIEHTVDTYELTSMKAYDNCKKFTWDNISKQLHDIYKASLGSFTKP